MITEKLAPIQVTAAHTLIRASRLVLTIHWSAAIGMLGQQKVESVRHKSCPLSMKTGNSVKDMAMIPSSSQ